MPNEILSNADYKNWISNICAEFKKSQIKAAVRVNSEMIEFYLALD